MSVPELGGAQPASRLERRLGVADAVVIGLGSMIGGGIFVVIGPAVEAAGVGMLLGLAAAAVVALCNATSSAQLAAVYPDAGGTYAYGRRRLGAFWGYLAGWGFVVGKLASCTALALAFATYVEVPSWATRPLAIAAVVVLTAVNVRGIAKTAALTSALVAVVLVALVAAVVAMLGGGQVDIGRLRSLSLESPGDAKGVLEAAGLLFFAFAGYARIATLGEEVLDPARTIPWAIPLALGLTLVIYAVVAGSALAVLGPAALAAADAPLAAAVEVGRLKALMPTVSIGASVASLGVLLSLLVGVSRTAFAMAARGDLPRWLAAVHPRFKVPHRAELAVAAVVVTATAVVDLDSAIGFSAFTVLAYYAITNVCALTLASEQRRWSRRWAAMGVVGCVGLAFNLPRSALATGTIILGVGAAAFLLTARKGPASEQLARRCTI